jgi:CRP-like cAMP-binding protein
VNRNTSPPTKASALDPLVRKLDYWHKLDAADRAAVLALPHTVKSLEQHFYIIRERDRATHSCLLLSGFAIRHKIVAGGLRQIVAIHMKGDMVDLQNSLLGCADHSVQALTRAEVAFIPRDAIRKIAFDRPAVGMAMWQDTLVDGSIFREWIANVGRRDARTRLAHLLCEFALRSEAAGIGTHAAYTLPMTQEQLADATGLTAVHVNRTLRGLDADGVVKRTKRNVTVADWKRLAETGDFTSTYLHLRPDQLELVE